MSAAPCLFLSLARCVRTVASKLEPMPRHDLNVRIKRVYLEPEEADGIRILVDRLWPRGLTKQKAKIDIWLKEIAPSTDLRKWFDHDLGKWAEFQTRYLDELKLHSERLAFLRQKAAQATVTLLFGARDEQHNEAVILHELLQTGGSRPGRMRATL